jgi:hypothetical protein
MMWGAGWEGGGETPTLTPCVSHKSSLGSSHDESGLWGWV